MYVNSLSLLIYSHFLQAVGEYLGGVQIRYAIFGKEVCYSFLSQRGQLGSGTSDLLNHTLPQEILFQQNGSIAEINSGAYHSYARTSMILDILYCINPL